MGASTDEGSAAVSYLGLLTCHKNDIRCPDECSKSDCGREMRLYFNGNNSTPETLLAGLMRLPVHIRHDIYDLVVHSDAPIKHPTMWLNSSQALVAPDIPAYRADPRLPLVPTLENKGGDWDPDKICCWAFCRSQGFAEALHKLGKTGNQSATRCLEDFLILVGERTVVELDNYNFIWKQSSSGWINSFEWFRSLKPYHIFLRHLSVEYENQIEFDYSKGRWVNSTIGYIAQCRYIQSALPNLKSVIFWFQLTREQLNGAIYHARQEPWFEASKLIDAEKVDVKLVIDPDFGQGERLTRSSEWDRGFLRRGLSSVVDEEGASMLQKILSAKRIRTLTDDLDDFDLESLWNDESLA
ncbi:uncharacterized protein LY89DRAFT_125925 [Mollisia scopiformis]|uniref:Uncharacterized protein n=1 Tax=Mollisia scopiformis TaxID=149040 RepID=A0A194X427_MOLSC|nr:uncharacterized protein LY89DRAFT_125925 [Mollisia scopiformis]KUJ14943.1 hypothetical protein LY89DRAFT_125925 [Mollisia scopiformis]